jgi:hypothetical protein
VNASKRAATLFSTPQTNPPTPANRRGGCVREKVSFWSEPRGPIVFFKARLGIAASAGSPLKRSVPWGFAVAQHGFRGFDRGSSYFFRGIRRLRPAVPPWSWKPAETVRSLGFCRGAARLSRLRPGSTSCFSIGGSEGYVRHCRLGAGSPLKRSVP